MLWEKRYAQVGAEVSRKRPDLSRERQAEPNHQYGVSIPMAGIILADGGPLGV